jgi:hypothetical protein
MSARRGVFALAQRAFASHAGRAGEVVEATSNAHRHVPGGVIDVRGRRGAAGGGRSGRQADGIVCPPRLARQRRPENSYSPTRAAAPPV